MDAKLSIGTRLRQLRRERNLSQKELAAQCGLSLNCISLIERDEISPNVATLQRLASALDVKMHCFFEDSFQADVIDVIHVKEGPLHSSIDNSVVSLDGVCSSIEEEAIKPFVLTLKPHACASATSPGGYSGYTVRAGHGFG
jgi:transcriptional regulator with XRE-family HTH domain